MNTGTSGNERPLQIVHSRPWQRGCDLRARIRVLISKSSWPSGSGLFPSLRGGDLLYKGRFWCILRAVVSGLDHLRLWSRLHGGSWGNIDQGGATCGTVGTGLESLRQVQRFRGPYVHGDLSLLDGARRYSLILAVDDTPLALPNTSGRQCVDVHPLKMTMVEQS